jgi:hypothetical protein
MSLLAVLLPAVSALCPPNRNPGKWTERCTEARAYEFAGCWFGDCQAGARQSGGAICCMFAGSDTASNLTDCAFTRCRTTDADGGGGAVCDLTSLGSTAFDRCCATACDAVVGGFYHCAQGGVRVALAGCSVSRCAPLTPGWAQCSGGGALYHYGVALLAGSNFTGNRVTYGGADLWSYGESAAVRGCIFRGGEAPSGMVYSVYQADVVDISGSIFMDSASVAFHSHGSTGGSLIVAVNCSFARVGGFEAAAVGDAAIVLIDCEFSNATIWLSGPVSVTREALAVTRSIVVHPPAEDRECVWYGPHQALFPTATRSATRLQSRTPTETATTRRSPNATWAVPQTNKNDEATWSLVVAMLGGIGAAALVIIVIGVIAIKSKPAEPEEVIEDSIPAYTE